MHDLAQIVLLTAAAGACLPLGGFLGRIKRLGPHWLDLELRHTVIAFGAGILLAGVAFVLVPEGSALLGAPLAGFSVLLLGGAAFFLYERLIDGRKRVSPQFNAMLLDFIPESLALGGVLAAGSSTAQLLALLIGLQNIPEGFNAYRELSAMPGARPRRIMALMIALVPIGPIVGVAGWLLLSQHEAILGTVMLFASGGILYLIFQDIAPQTRLARHWAPPLGAVAGFGLGLLGQQYFSPGI